MVGMGNPKVDARLERTIQFKQHSSPKFVVLLLLWLLLIAAIGT